MSPIRPVVPLSILLAFTILSCSSDSKPSSPTPQPGRVTARIENLPGQVGNTLAVMAYDVDWQPGSNAPAVAAVSVQITDESFSTSQVLQSLNANGEPTGQAKQFDPGVNSVVFFVAALNSPPAAWTEIRATVDGDISVTAPPWSQWQHP